MISGAIRIPRSDVHVQHISPARPSRRRASARSTPTSHGRHAHLPREGARVVRRRPQCRPPTAPRHLAYRAHELPTRHGTPPSSPLLSGSSHAARLGLHPRPLPGLRELATLVCSRVTCHHDARLLLGASTGRTPSDHSPISLHIASSIRAVAVFRNQVRVPFTPDASRGYEYFPL